MQIVSKVASADGRSVKYAQKTSDGFLVETTYVDHGEKQIICFSSQVGCPIGCHFCKSGDRADQKRFRRSLLGREIVAQCENIILARQSTQNIHPILFSAMGEGEPLLNIGAVVKALVQLGERYPGSKGAISTSGIFPLRIRGLTDIRFPFPLKLQISLHAPDDRLRRKLIPSSAPLRDIITAGSYYAYGSGNSVEWNYVLLQGINDAPRHAHALTRVLPSGAHVKLNRFNEMGNEEFSPSSRVRMKCFIDILRKVGLVAEPYTTNGGDIGAACGQLTYRPAMLVAA